VKKSPAKKKNESQASEKKPKVKKMEEATTSKYFNDVKEEPQDPDENVQKIKMLKKVKKESKPLQQQTIKTEPIIEVCIAITSYFFFVFLTGKFSGPANYAEDYQEQGCEKMIADHS